MFERTAAFRSAHFVLGAGLILGCGDPREASRVTLSVSVSNSGLDAVETDLGYRVELSEARMVVSDLVFAIAGEAHAASIWNRASSWFIGTANAHPGHYQGGEVTGELQGRFFVDWLPNPHTVQTGKQLFQTHCAECHGPTGAGRSGPSIAAHPSIAESVATGPGAMPAFTLSDAEVNALQSYVSQHVGEATLIEGVYHSANFTFSIGREDEGLHAGDPLLGNTAVLRGTALKDDHVTNFLALLTSDEDRQLVGAPFDSHVTKATHERLEFRLLTRDPLEDDTLFDGIDFAGLDFDRDGSILLTAPDSNRASGTNEAVGGGSAAESVALADSGAQTFGEEAGTDDSRNSSTTATRVEALSNAYNQLKRTYQTHDHFDIHPVTRAK